MLKKEFKLLPCIFCTIGYNSYVGVNRLAVSLSKKLKLKGDPDTIEDNMNPIINKTSSSDT